MALELSPLVAAEKDLYKIVSRLNQTIEYINTNLLIGQIVGSAGDDEAAAGSVGEHIESTANASSKTVTISNASPAVISCVGHGIGIGNCVNFTTTGGLPTGLSIGTNYYASITGYGDDAYSVSTSVDNALAGTNVNTSSAGSGTHTGHNSVIAATGVGVDVCGISLTAGDWLVLGRGAFLPAATTVMTHPNVVSSSLVSGTLDLTTLLRGISVPLPQAGSTGGGGWNGVLPPVHFALAVPMTIYLVMMPTFTTSTMNCAGTLAAIRHR